MKKIIAILTLVAAFIFAAYHDQTHDGKKSQESDLKESFDFQTMDYLNLEGELTRENIEHSFAPRTSKLSVPPASAEGIKGFFVGFVLSPENSSGLIQFPDSIRILKCQYSIYRLDAMSGEESLLSTNEGTQSEPFKFVASFTWDPAKGFTPPAANQGYVIRWDVHFIPVYKGRDLPEAVVAPEFVYKVIEVPPPIITTENVDGKTVVKASGDQVEFFKLQRSADGQKWEDVPFHGDMGWAHPYTVRDFSIPGTEGYMPDTYQWILDPMSPSDSYRMIWTGKPGAWKIWMPEP